MNVHLGLATLLLCSTLVLTQTSSEPFRPEWCQQLPRAEYKALERVDVGSDWFEVYRVRPGVLAIYEPHQFEEVISYLILGEQRAILFDTGLGVDSIRAVVLRLTSLPVTVINSHTHFDHVGGNFEFRDVRDEDIRFAHDNAKGRLNGYSRDALAPGRICGKLPPGVQPDSYRIRPWQITGYVHDGERFYLGGRQLEVIFTPGHTPDSLSLLDRKNGLLFIGDTFYRGPIYLLTPETDFAAYARSVAKLALLVPQLSLILPGHNVAAVEAAYLTRLNEAVKKVEAGEVRPAVTDGRREYRFEGFSLLLSAK